MYIGKWTHTISNIVNNSYCVMIVRLRIVLNRTVVGD